MNIYEFPQEKWNSVSKSKFERQYQVNSTKGKK